METRHVERQRPEIWRPTENTRCFMTTRGSTGPDFTQPFILTAANLPQFMAHLGSAPFTGSFVFFRGQLAIYQTNKLDYRQIAQRCFDTIDQINMRAGGINIVQLQTQTSISIFGGRSTLNNVNESQLRVVAQHLKSLLPNTKYDSVSLKVNDPIHGVPNITITASVS